MANEPARKDMELHYALGLEEGRLFRNGKPRLEFVRTLELLERYLPPPPASLLDVGGGAGAYARVLANLGYQVHLIEPIPLHVEQARKAAASQPNHPFTATLGEAQELAAADASVDGVLLLGPLYHLTERSARLQALREAHRVLRRAGQAFAVGIPRFRSLISGLFSGDLHDSYFRPIVEGDLRDGQHRNPDPAGHPERFTTAFFHRPDELAEEMIAAGFRVEALLGIEGPGWLVEDRWDDPDQQENILFAARSLEAEPNLLGMNTHLLAIGRRI